MFSNENQNETNNTLTAVLFSAHAHKRFWAAHKHPRLRDLVTVFFSKGG